MKRSNNEYEIRAMVCDWALDIPMVDATFELYFNSRNNAEMVKAILEWEDAHPNKALPYSLTLTPPNEPLTWDELAEMEGQPVYIVEMGARRYWALVARVYKDLADFVTVDCVNALDPDDYGDKELYGESWVAYRRPMEGEGKPTEPPNV